MKAIWITDPHLNFLPQNTQWITDDKESLKPPIYSFGEKLSPHGDCLIISGDVDEAPGVDLALIELQKGFGKPIYFVLGNHDYYHGSFKDVQKKIKNINNDNIVYLANNNIELDKSTVLTGSDGWYDARVGNPYNLLMNDWKLIKEYQPMIHYDNIIAHSSANKERVPMGAVPVKQSYDSIMNISRDIADKQAKEVKKNLGKLVKDYSKIYFVTHIPPFPGAAWYRGKISEGSWLPWFTNCALGNVLAEVADNNSSCDITVLCGHTHGGGTYTHFDNLRVWTGSAQYGSPNISRIIDV